MTHDIPEQIPQRGSAPQDEENSIRFAAVADELERVCRLYAPQPRNGKKDVLQLEAEQRAAERWAKENYTLSMPKSDNYKRLNNPND